MILSILTILLCLGLLALLLLFRRDARRRAEVQDALLQQLAKGQERILSTYRQEMSMLEVLQAQMDGLERTLQRRSMSTMPREAASVEPPTREPRAIEESTFGKPQPPPLLDPLRQLTDTLNQYIEDGAERNWRRYLLKNLPEYQNRLLPVEPGEAMGTAESVLQVFDDSQEKKFFAFPQEGTLHIFPNSGNISGYALKTRDIFDGYDDARGFSRVHRPAQAKKNEDQQWVIVRKGLLL